MEHASRLPAPTQIVRWTIRVAPATSNVRRRMPASCAAGDGGQSWFAGFATSGVAGRPGASARSWSAQRQSRRSSDPAQTSVLNRVPGGAVMTAAARAPAGT